MGVTVDPARKDAEGAWHFDSVPESPGWTYSHWHIILDRLMLLGECRVEMGTMPIAMLEAHLTVMGHNLEDSEYDQLADLMTYCDQHGYAHIGWA